MKIRQATHENVNEVSCFDPRVRDLMTSNPFTLSVEDSLENMQDVMEWRGIRHLPVVDEEGNLVGLVSQRDFLKLAISKLADISARERKELYSKILIREIMGKKVTTVSPDSSLKEAGKVMFEKKYGCLPVVEGRKLVGIITEADFVKAFCTWEIALLRGSS